ncbi:MAG: hypothetical protein JXB38_14990 [Anaerolineales bacterium]|nr:hypothetical protein [Anaerolineales bacterium]
MDNNAVIAMEISFNILYLIVIWGMVIAMFRKLSQVQISDQVVGKGFLWAFFLLALGDTGHVGFRVWAYALGDISSTINLFGIPIGLVGVGALSTAYTVTLFYMLMLVIWKQRTNKAYTWFGWLLFILAGFRLVLMALPGNEWNSVVPPQPMSLYRNALLTAQGLGVAYLILRDARADKDTLFTKIGIFILLSYAFYIPVILFVQKAPMIGMLMIPKTLMYVAIAWLAYKQIFSSQASQSA